MDSDFDIALAIIDHTQLPQPLTSLPRTHVKNHIYKVRWRGKRHTEDSWEAYEAVWHQFAFEDFIAGSQLTGHVPPSAYARAHRQHVNSLLRNEVPERDVAIVEPHAINHALRDYVMLEHPAPRNPRALQESQRQHDAEQAHYSQSQSHIAQLNHSSPLQPSAPIDPAPPSPDSVITILPHALYDESLAHQPSPLDEAAQATLSNTASSSSHPELRRSNRQRQPSSFGEDFTT